MLIPILIASCLFVAFVDAAAIVSRSQSYPLSSRNVLGPHTSITINNAIIAPDGFVRS